CSPTWMPRASPGGAATCGSEGRAYPFPEPAALRLLAGHAGDGHHIGDDLAEGIWVCQEPRVVAVDDLALGAEGGAHGGKGLLGHDAVLVTPQHDDRQLPALQLLQLRPQVGPPGQVGDTPQAPRVADQVGPGVL